MLTKAIAAAIVLLSVTSSPANSASFVAPNPVELRMAAPRSYSRASRIVYRNSCGWQGSGRAAYVQNSARAASVVTVRESCNCGQERWSRTMTFHLAPGEELRIGCTRGDTAVEFKGYSVVAERGR
jgi:hypothetical protein